MVVLRCSVSAENSSKIVLEFDTSSNETDTYQVLISETAYLDGQRMTNLYREDFKVQKTPMENGKALRTVVCVGSVTPVGGTIRRLEPSGYYLTIDKTGRILGVKDLKPWDGRRIETIWLAQALLPEHPVEPGTHGRQTMHFSQKPPGIKHLRNVLIAFWA